MVEVVNMRTCNPPWGQPGDVRIDRASIYGSPFKIGEGYTRDSACDAYEAWFLRQHFDLNDLLHAKRLGCWCFGKGTLVTTKRGFVPIEDVVVGDMVLSHDSKYHTVTEIMQWENAPTVAVKFHGVPEPIICTPDHAFYACRRLRVQSNYERKIVTYPPSWIPAKELRKCLNTSHSCGTVIGFPIDMENDTDTHTCEFWYIVGRYLGDGNTNIYSRPSGYVKNDGTMSNGHHFSVSICTGKPDAERLRKKIVDAGFEPRMDDRPTEVTFRIFNKELTLFLTQFGKYCYGKYIPEWCFSLSHSKQKSLLLGLVESDGYIDIKRGKTTITTVSRLLAYGIARLCRNATHARVSICKKSLSNAESIVEGGRVIRATLPAYAISWMTDSAGSESTDNCVWMSFRAISESTPQTVYNISVAGSESYVVGGGVAVHNCKPRRCHGDFIKRKIDAYRNGMQKTLLDGDGA